MNSERMTPHAYCPVAVATAGTAGDLFVVCGFGGKSVVRRLDFVSDGGVTANNTNNAVFTASVGGTTIGTMTTNVAGTGDIADGGVASMVLTAAASNLVAEGGAVKIAITKGGSGVAIAGQVAVTFERVRAD